MRSSGSRSGEGLSSVSARSPVAVHVGTFGTEDERDLEMDVSRHLVMGLQAFDEGCDRTYRN